MSNIDVDVSSLGESMQENLNISKLNMLKFLISKINKLDKLLLLIVNSISPYTKTLANTDNISDIENYINNYLLKSKYFERNSSDNFLNTTENLLDWYKTKNPNFEVISNVSKLSMPEFKSLLITICLHLIKLLIELKFPGKKTVKNGLKINNKKTNKSYNYYNKKITSKPNDTEFTLFMDLLQTICNLNLYNESEDNYYSYVQIMEIYLTYIAYMSGLFIKNIGQINVMQAQHKSLHFKNDNCIDFIEYCHQIYLNTPFILYPTFNQISEITVLKTLSAPIVNFYITYTRSLSHDYYMPPCSHIEHDVIFHGTLTHFHLLLKLNDELNKLYNYKELVYRRYTFKDIQEIKKIYEQVLEPLFSYVSSFNPNIPANFSIIQILFELFHESIESIKYIFKKGRNTKITMILKNISSCSGFMIDFYETKIMGTNETKRKDNYKIKIDLLKNSSEKLSEFITQYMIQNNITDQTNSGINSSNNIPSTTRYRPSLTSRSFRRNINNATKKSEYFSRWGSLPYRPGRGTYSRK